MEIVLYLVPVWPGDGDVNPEGERRLYRDCVLSPSIVGTFLHVLEGRAEHELLWCGKAEKYCGSCIDATTRRHVLGDELFNGFSVPSEPLFVTSFLARETSLNSRGNVLIQLASNH